MPKLLLAGLIAAVAVPAFAQMAPPMAPMTNDRVMTRGEVQGHVAQMFARLDTNRDGVVLKAEAEAARQGMHGNNGQRGDHQRMRGMHRDPSAAFARMDANRDNMISREEFSAAHAQRAQKMAARGQDGRAMRGKHGMGGKMFERADTNRDGRLTQAEAQAQAFAHFDMMDGNRDGRVTREERQTARQTMMQNKGR